MEKSSVLSKPQEVAFRGDYITLGQFLKLVRIIDEGGLAKWYLSTHRVLVNGEPDARRGRKLRAEDAVTLEDGRTYRFVAKK